MCLIRLYRQFCTLPSLFDVSIPLFLTPIFAYFHESFQHGNFWIGISKEGLYCRHNSGIFLNISCEKHVNSLPNILKSLIDSWKFFPFEQSNVCCNKWFKSKIQIKSNQNPNYVVELFCDCLIFHCSGITGLKLREKMLWLDKSITSTNSPQKKWIH